MHIKFKIKYTEKILFPLVFLNPCKFLNLDFTRKFQQSMLFEILNSAATEPKALLQNAFD